MARFDAPLARAIRGPILLVVLGGLFAWEYWGGQPFRRTFPVLLILYGVLKLIERLLHRESSYGGGT